MQLHTHSNQKIPMAYSMIAAGPAVEIGEDFQMLDVAELITRGRDGFAAYTLTGFSDAPHMLPGYIVFVDTWSQPQSGDMIAAIINGQTCVKKFEHTNRGLRLVSRNADYNAREITPNDSFHVLGVVRGHLALYQ